MTAFAVKFGPGRCKFCGGPNGLNGTGPCERPGCQEWRGDFAAPRWSSERFVCQGWQCRQMATWARWARRYCTDHAIRAGWVPGPARRPGDQLGLQ